MNHIEKDCEMWLTSREKLRKEDQQFGNWLCTEQFKPFRKSVVVIAGSACGPSKWKKDPSVPKEQAFDPSVVKPASPDVHSVSVMDSNPPLEQLFFVSTSSNLHLAQSRSPEKELVIEGLSDGVAKLGKVALKIVHDLCIPHKWGQVFGNPAIS